MHPSEHSCAALNLLLAEHLYTHCYCGWGILAVRNVEVTPNRSGSLYELHQSSLTSHSALAALILLVNDSLNPIQPNDPFFTTI